MLLGNKMDKESEREVQAAVGERLAKVGLRVLELTAYSVYLC